MSLLPWNKTRDISNNNFTTAAALVRVPAPPTLQRECENHNNNNNNNNNKQVLVLGGGGDTNGYDYDDIRACASLLLFSGHHHNQIIMSSSSSSSSSVSTKSVTTQRGDEANTTLNFSMIATSGGKGIARVMINDNATASSALESSSSHFATPITNMLRGVVTLAADAVMTSNYNNIKTRSNNNNNNDDDDHVKEECTAIIFAKSAPHSELGKNIGNIANDERILISLIVLSCRSQR